MGAPRGLIWASSCAAAAVAAALANASGCGGSGGASSGSTAAAIGSGAAPATTAPAIQILTPTPGTTAQRQVLVAGEVRDRGGGVAEVRVAGRPVTLDPSGAFAETVDLEPGLNAVVVEAWDALGERSARHVALLAGDQAPATDPIPQAARLNLTGAGAAQAAALTTTPAPTGMPSLRWIPAHGSNYSRRSSARTIRYVVIHTIEGSEAGCISWFRNPRSNVSAHYVVSHTGRVTQMVRDQDVAWHVRSQNPVAIGIENEGYAGRNNWTDVQYRTLAQLTRALCDKYGLPRDRRHIVGHGELPGQTHTDPGRHFDWNRFMALVNPPARPTTKTADLTTALGQRVRVTWTPGAPATSAAGVAVDLTAQVEVPNPPASAGTGEAWVVGGPTTDPAAAAPGAEVALAVHQDLLNRVLHAAWQAGALDLRIDDAVLAQVAPQGPVTLHTEELVRQDPTLSPLLPHDQHLTLVVKAALPPVIDVGLGGADAARLGLGALELEVHAPAATGGAALPVVPLSRPGAPGAAAPVPAGPRTQLLAAATVTVTSEVELRAGQLVAGAIDLHVDADDPGSEHLVRALAPTAARALLGNLSGVAVPLPAGVAVADPQGRVRGDTFVASGDAR